MSDRLKSMQRVVAVQAQVKRIAEWKLAAIEQRKTALDAAQRDLAAFLDGGDLTGAFASVAMRQSQRLARRQAAADHEHERQAGVTQKAQARHRLAERMTETVAQDEHAADERKALEALIEEFMGRSESRR